jgi:hypothetical protein
VGRRAQHRVVLARKAQVAGPEALLEVAQAVRAILPPVDAAPGAMDGEGHA